MMGTQEQFHKLHLNRSKRLYKYTFHLFRMIHENSMSPESAIQGTGAGPWKDTTQHGQGEGGLQTQRRQFCFSVHSGATFTLTHCAHPAGAAGPRPAGRDVTQGQGSSAGTEPPLGQSHLQGSATWGTEPPSGQCHP